MRSIFALLLALTAFGAVAQPAEAPPAEGTRLDGIAAIVGDQVILYSEVEALVQQSTRPDQPAPPELWSRALDRLVDQRIVIARARQDTTLNVTEDLIRQQTDRQVDQLATQLGGEDALVAAYGRSIEEVRASFRDDVRDELLLQQYRGRRAQGIQITPGEVREWFERIPAADRPLIPELVRLAHVVKVPEGDRVAVRARVEALRDSIVAGQATIEELANRYSDDPGNTRSDGTQNGGLYTTLRLSDLESRFRAAASASEIGAISPVFETPFGYHVLRVNERQGEQISFNHILLEVEPDEAGVQAALAELAVLRDSIVTHGVPFEAIARRHSEDPYSASRGGFISADPQSRQRDLQSEGLGPAWKATIDTLSVGEISMPTEATLLDAGRSEVVHFVLLQRRTPPHTLAIEDDYALLSQYALQEKQNRVLAEWVDELRRTVYVDIRADQYRPASARPAAGG